MEYHQIAFKKIKTFKLFFTLYVAKFHMKKHQFFHYTFLTKLRKKFLEPYILEFHILSINIFHLKFVRLTRNL
jgi:hypothetical protein